MEWSDIMRSNFITYCTLLGLKEADEIKNERRNLEFQYPNKKELIQQLQKRISQLRANPNSNKHNTVLDKYLIYLAENADFEFVVKGGYLLNNIIPDDSRATMDVAFDIKSTEAYEDVKRVTTDFLEKAKGENLITDYSVNDTIQELKCGGFKAYFEGHIIASADVGLHPVTQGVQVYNIKEHDIVGYSVEHMLRDKIYAIFSKSRFRRPKDIYDYKLLTDTFDVNMKVYVEYLDEGLPTETESPWWPTIYSKYEYSYNAIPLKGKDIPFNDCVCRVKEFYEELCTPQNSMWSHQDRRFIC